MIETPSEVLKIISCNVSSLSNAWSKGFVDFAKIQSPDIICIQETDLNSCSADEIEDNYLLDGYHGYFCTNSNSSQLESLENKEKLKAGTAIYTKFAPSRISRGFNERDDPASRLLLIEFANFMILNVFAPDDDNDDDHQISTQFKKSLSELLTAIKESSAKNKPLILCGDFKDNDISKDNDVSVSSDFFSYDEDESNGFVDSFRYFHEDKQQFTLIDEQETNRRRCDFFLVQKNSLISSSESGFVFDSTIENCDFSNHMPIALLLDKEIAIDVNKDVAFDLSSANKVVTDVLVKVKERKKIGRPKGSTKDKIKQLRQNKEEELEYDEKPTNLYSFSEDEDEEEEIELVTRTGNRRVLTRRNKGMYFNFTRHKHLDKTEMKDKEYVPIKKKLTRKTVVGTKKRGRPKKDHDVVNLDNNAEESAK